MRTRASVFAAACVGRTEAAGHALARAPLHERPAELITTGHGEELPLDGERTSG